MAVLGVIAAGVIALSLLPDRGQPIEVSASQIDRIQAYPYPEGSPGPAFARDAGKGEIPLETVISSVPIPLPPATGCPGEVVLEITLSDGRHIDYGHCDYPDELQSLSDAMRSAWSAT